MEDPGPNPADAASTPAAAAPTTAAAAAPAAAATAWSLYYRQGFDEGYRRAISDVVRSLLDAGEAYIAERRGRMTDRGAAALRKALTPFERYLERRIHRMAADESAWVEGGMGI